MKQYLPKKLVTRGFKIFLLDEGLWELPDRKARLHNFCLSSENNCRSCSFASLAIGVSSLSLSISP